MLALVLRIPAVERVEVERKRGPIFEAVGFTDLELLPKKPQRTPTNHIKSQVCLFGVRTSKIATPPKPSFL